MSRNERMGMLYMFTAVLGYSFFPTFTKLLLAEGMQPLDIGLWRFVFAVAILWAIRVGVSARQGERFKLPRLPVVPVLIMGAMLAVAALAGFFGLERLPTATYIVLFYTYPMMTAFIEAALGQRLPRVAWIALALTLLGVIVTAPDFSEGLQGGNLSGVLIAFINAFVVAIYYIVSSRTLKGFRDTVGASAAILTATLGVMLVGAALAGSALPPTPTAWLLIVGMAVIGTVMPVFAINKGIPKLGAATAGILGSIEPLTSSIFALIFLGEQMNASQWIGGLVIVAGIIVLQLPALVSRRAEETVAPPIANPD